MATLPTAQYWIRTDGNDANGGGYDSGISGAATNYCDQASPQATFTLLTLLTGTLTDTGSLGLFTAAMIGNAVNVPGQGYYWITARTNGNVVTVTPGTGATTSFTTQPGKVGGAFRNPYALANNGQTPATATPLVAGNTLNIRGSGSGSVGSPDYTQTSQASYPNGNTTDGYVSWTAYNATPYIKGDGLWFYNTNYHRMTGLYVTASSNTNGTLFLLNGELVLVNCTLDANNQSVSGVTTSGSTGLTLIGCDLLGSGSSSGSGVVTGDFGTSLKNCKVHGWGAWGIRETTNVASRTSNCAIYLNVSGGIQLDTIGGLASIVDGCTIDSNTGDGIEVTAIPTAVCILNNNITANGGYGINLSSGTTVRNDAGRLFIDYNNFGSGGTVNTSGAYHNISAGAHDLNVDPGYANAGAGQFTPSNAALIATAPITFA